MELSMRQNTTKVDELNSYVHKIVCLLHFPALFSY
jgi:hypothetical protein